MLRVETPRRVFLYISTGGNFVSLVDENSTVAAPLRVETLGWILRRQQGQGSAMCVCEVSQQELHSEDSSLNLQPGVVEAPLTALCM